MTDEIDIEFKFYTDTPPHRDPDSHSPTLRRYHRKLWSKALPNGQRFELVDTHPKSYLYHNSELGDFFLTSDAISHSYCDTKRLAQLIKQIPVDVVKALFDHGSTIGAYTIFPGNKLDKKMTINGARGCNSKIVDRFDITLECIRRHYSNVENPLTAVLERYRDFFALFGDFKGYVNFFFFQDLVTADYSEVAFYMPYKCFEDFPLPRTKEDYLKYQESSVKFVQSRGKRMQDWLRSQCAAG